MERLSDKCPCNTPDCTHGGQCDYGCEKYAEWVSRIRDRLAAYEDVGLEPAEIDAVAALASKNCSQTADAISALLAEDAELQAYRASGLTPADLPRAAELAKTEKDGLCVVLDEKTALTMAAGARAIENNKKLWGVTYGWDIFGECGGPKEISYFEAAKRLRELAESALTRAEAEAALHRPLTEK